MTYIMGQSFQSVSKSALLQLLLKSESVCQALDSFRAILNGKFYSIRKVMKDPFLKNV
jgi:hypothetical protein